MNNISSLESKIKGKGRFYSIAVHVAILLFAIFYHIPQHPDEERGKETYEVSLDMTEFRKIIPVSKPKPPRSDIPLQELNNEESSNSRRADDDEGVLRPKSESAPNEAEMNRNTPSHETTSPSTIDAPKTTIETPKQPDIKVPGPKVIPNNDEIISSNTDNTPSAPPSTKGSSSTTTTTKGSGTKASGSNQPGTSNTAGSTTGNSTTRPSTVDGSPGGTGKGKTGSGAGMSSGTDGDGGLGDRSDGTGIYDGSGNGVFGRKVIARDLQTIKSVVRGSGKAVVKVCINRAGNVTFAEIIQSETTFTDREGLKKFLQAAWTYKFQADLSAPKEQCGKLTFTVDNTVNNKLH